jgi:hypothetical protein
LETPYPKFGAAEKAVVNVMVAVGVEELPVVQLQRSPLITFLLSANTYELVSHVGE